MSVTQTGFAGDGLASNGVVKNVLSNNDEVLHPAQPVAQPSYASYVSRDVPARNMANIVSLPGMPVFVLNTGAILSVSGYGYQDDRITYSLIGGGNGVISANDIDWNSTTQLNAQRGLRVTLHSAHASTGTAGF